MSARPHLEAFEPRLLYSADALSLAMGLSAGSMVYDDAWAQATSSLTSFTSAATAVTLPGVEIVVLDTSVADSASLLNDLSAQQRAGRPLEVLTLNAGEDGIARISELLAQRDNISALHLLGHGADGVVVLGTSQLSGSTLLARAGEIANWGRAFSADADFLIYGCDVAAGATGQQLVRDLAAITGTDVAASTDTTASSLRGGNWVLENQTGSIEATLALSVAEQQSYSGSLQTHVVTRFTDDNDPGSLRWAIAQANQGRNTDTITLSAGTYLLSLSNGSIGANLGRDLDITNSVTIVGAGAGQTVIESQGNWRHFEVHGGVLNLSGLTLRGGSQAATDTTNADSRGGSIYVHAGAGLVLSQAVIENSAAQNGGAIFVQGAAALTDVELRDNTARNHGGAVYNEGALSLNRVTVASNQAVTDGGGVYHTGINVLTLTNVTLSGNRATHDGGGVFADAAASLTNVSVVNNTVGQNYGGGIHVKSGAQVVEVINSLFSGNVNDVGDTSHSNRRLTSGGNNLIANQGGVLLGIGDRNVSNIQLAALADNGGFGRTHALLQTSPAVNSANTSAAPATDQRGTLRQGSADIGAFEYTNAAPYFSNLSLTIGAGGVAAPIVDVSDKDGDNVTVYVDAVSGGYFARSGNLATAIDRFNGSEPLFGFIQFVHTGGSAAPTFSLRASDALNAGTSVPGTVYFTAANSAPVVAATPVILASTPEDTSTLITQAQLLAGVTDANGDPVGALNLRLTGASVSSGSVTALGGNNAAASGLGSGLKGEYFANMTLSGAPLVTRTEAVDFNWGSTAPTPTTALPADGFSARWTGFVVPASSGEFIFRTESDDGIRVWINGTPVIDQWNLHSTMADVSEPLTLQAGTAYSIKVDYFENAGVATARLQWKTPGSSTYSAIPAARLFDAAPPPLTTWRYAPATNFNGTASFAYEVSDGRGGLVTNNASLSVMSAASLNDAPTVLTNILTITEGESVFLTNSQIKTTDANDNNSRLTITVSDLQGGFFEFAATPGTAITSFLQSDIDDVRVRFVHDASNTAPTYRLTVSDSYGASVTSLPTVNFTATNDAPVITANGLSITEGGSATPWIQATDEESLSAQLTFSVTNLVGGRFELIGAAGTAITQFTQAQLDNDQVRFVDSGSGVAPTYWLSVRDGATSASRSASMPVNILRFTAVNDRPVFTQNSLTVNEGGSAVPNIKVLDNDNEAAQITIFAFDVMGGRFELTSSPGQAISQFTQQQVDRGEVRFVDSGSGTAPSYSLAAADPALLNAAANVALPRAVGTVVFSVVNDAPVFTSNDLVITEGGTSIPQIQVTDEDHSATELRITVSALVGGRFELLSAPGVALMQFTQAQLDAGAVRFVHDGFETVPGYALSVSDAQGAQATSAAPRLTYTPVNDAPVLLSNQLRITEAGFAVPSIQVSDVDSAAEQLRFTVSNTSGGQFELVGASGVGILTFTKAQLDASAVRFVHDGSVDAPRYRLALSDGDNLQSSDAVVAFTPLPAAPLAVVVPNTRATSATSATTAAAPTAPTSTSDATATHTAPAAATKPSNVSAADVLVSRAAAAEAAAAEAAAADAQAHANSQVAGAMNRNATALSTRFGDGRDSAVRVAVSASSNSPNTTGTAAGGDARWANASVAAGTINLQNLLLGGDASSLDWNSSSSSLLDRKLLDAVLGSSDSSVRNTALDKAFERIREELDQGAQADGQAVAGSLVLSTSFSVGYVLWLARGGVLLASMASSIPAWATVDPLPVLSRFKARQGESDGDGDGDGGLGGTQGDRQGDKADALERLFSKAKKVFSGSESAPVAAVSARAPAPAPAATSTATATSMSTSMSMSMSSEAPATVAAPAVNTLPNATHASGATP